MGEETCDQLEGVKAIYSFATFQNGEFTVAENSLAKNEYICKLDLKDVSHFLRTIKREWCFDGKKLCTSFCACALALHQPHMFSQNS